jgi:hypothetical protein
MITKQTFGRKMFLLQYALEVKMGEKTRLEKTLKVGFGCFFKVCL